MKIKIQILLAFSIILGLSILDSASNYWLSLKVEENIQFLNKSQDIIRNSDELSKSTITMQSAFRGYLLSNDTSYLESYNSALKNTPMLFNKLRSLINANKKQVGLLDSIRILNKQWVDYASDILDANNEALNSEAGIAKYNNLFETKFKAKIGKKLNDQIAAKFASFDKTEYTLRELRRDNLIKSIMFTHRISFIFFLLTLILGLGSLLYITRSISKRINTMVKQAKRISEGNFTQINDSKNDELTSLSISLNVMSGSLNSNIRELEKRNQELDKFAYVVSHDLKAPVRGIHNVVKWIEEDLGNEITPAMKKYLDIIPQRTKRMEDLINGLLDYARLNAKALPEKTDVNKMINDIVESIVPRKFHVQLENLPVLYTERLKLEQVFTNLISNSVKYTQCENPGLIIRCTEHKEYYEFSVKDNGIGIEPEYHEKIFEMFQTLREKDEKESTGIGLAIVKRIIDDLHGSIRIKSVLNEGAEFIFTWPKNLNI